MIELPKQYVGNLEKASSPDGPWEVVREIRELGEERFLAKADWIMAREKTDGVYLRVQRTAINDVNRQK